MAFDARIPYALVDMDGRIQSQNYAWPDELESVDVPEGQFLHPGITRDGRPAILNPDRHIISEPGSPDAVWLERPMAELAFPAIVMTDAAGVFVLPAPDGTLVQTADGAEHAAAGGELAVTFVTGGAQMLMIRQTDRSARQVRVIVRLLSGTLAAIRAEIDAWRDGLLAADITVAGVTLDGDAASQGNIEAAAIQGFVTELGGGTYEMPWITADNTVVTLTAAQLRAFTDAIGVRRGTEYARARAAKDAVLACADAASAEAARDAYFAGA